MNAKKAIKPEQEKALEVREEFLPYGTKTLDSKDRITLGGRLKHALSGRMNVDGFMVYVAKNGDILLRPSVSVPSSEAWIYSDRQAVTSIRKGLKEAGEKKTTAVNDLDKFLDGL